MKKTSTSDQAEWNELVRAAWAVRDQAYAPYSGFRVGAAVMVEDGSIFSGCNVENLSYGLTLCAERAAVMAAVAAGKRDLKRIAIVAESAEPVTPCGACRQVLAEFNDSLTIRTVNYQGESLDFSLSDLLPRPKAGILG